MSTWLEHQAGSNPVVFREKVLTAVKHRLSAQLRNAATGNHTNRIPAGVTVDAKKV
jgi:hypothetical protein